MTQWGSSGAEIPTLLVLHDKYGDAALHATEGIAVEALSGYYFAHPGGKKQFRAGLRTLSVKSLTLLGNHVQFDNAVRTAWPGRQKRILSDIQRELESRSERVTSPTALRINRWSPTILVTDGIDVVDVELAALTDPAHLGRAAAVAKVERLPPSLRGVVERQIRGLELE